MLKKRDRMMRKIEYVKLPKRQLKLPFQRFLIDSVLPIGVGGDDGIFIGTKTYHFEYDNAIELYNLCFKKQKKLLRREFGHDPTEEELIEKLAPIKQNKELRMMISCFAFPEICNSVPSGDSELLEVLKTDRYDAIKKLFKAAT
eukprot:TRINITY_DN13860_c0_g1_i8.p1 TRINITY_DN13860_c0_g1~~TRINITY_DN13860_c0_g1_i8.p1  ORF type:complete len:144 (-),score=26.61 TRINITY_DN13860_c0_g1_i8:310-741(-)